MKKLLSGIFGTIATLWLALTLSEYFLQHPTYERALWDFPFAFVALTTFGVTLITYFFIRKLPQSNNHFSFYGWQVILYAIIFVFTLMSVYGLSNSVFTDIGYFSGISYFLFKFLILSFQLYFIVGVCYTIGAFVENSLQKWIGSLANGFYTKIAFGIVVLTTGLFLLGTTSLLSPIPVWILCLTLLLLGYRHVKGFLVLTLLKKHTVSSEITLKDLGFVWIISLAILLSLMHQIKPFPIGWDASNLYVNIPNLIARQGTLVQGIDAYNWSLFMSLGTLLFNSIEVVMGLSWLGGVLALGVIASFSKRYLSESYVKLLLVLLVLLPSIIFMLSRDMKIDLGLLFLSFTVLSLTFSWIFPQNDSQNISTKAIIIILGILCGFLFGVKYTSTIFIVLIATSIAYYFGKQWLSIAFSSFCIILASLASITLFAHSELPGVPLSIPAPWVVLSISTLLTIYSALRYLKLNSNKSNTRNFVTSLLLFGTSLIIGFSPWILFHLTQSTNNIEISTLLRGTTESPRLEINKLSQQKISLEEIGVEQVSPTNNVGEQSVATTGVTEAVTRYIGYEEGALRILSLPYDVIMNTNVSSAIADIGPLLLSLLPIISFILLYKRHPRLAAISISSFFILLLVPSILSTLDADLCSQLSFSCYTDEFISRSEQTVLYRIAYYPLLILNPVWGILLTAYSFLGESFGVALVLITSVVSLYFTTKIFREHEELQLLSGGTILYLLIWLFIGTGIYWYGLIGFILLYLFLVIVLEKITIESPTSTWARIGHKVGNFVIGCYIFIAFFSFFTPKSPGDENLFVPTIASYMTRPQSVEDTLRDINFAYADGYDEINQNLDTNVYKVGTLMNYFIHDNNKRVFNDNQLDTFNKLYTKSDSHEELAIKLHNSGFNYLVVDLNTNSLDRTEEQTLTKKMNKMEAFMQQNSKLRLVATDRLVEDEDGVYQIQSSNGITTASRGMTGTIVSNGSIAIFEFMP
ncbi:hypothetical protein KC717_00325 [Candidatus Dojkabacteria bacterium]|uniref:Glycosyltransferase RgtA/B/C/D-like domain-containing protein n=1 Tax=Candidatus Dojkabacteria bacterium TaxID=2099670 RepID=A0A955L776_9BACT|nr:hypothetical protein [Candidatus Dojkabacteria bacterium]